MDINNLLRELSGPRPLCRGVDIVSKPRICSHGASAVTLETQPTYQTTGDGKDGNPDTRISSYVGVHDAKILRY